MTFARGFGPAFGGCCRAADLDRVVSSVHDDLIYALAMRRLSPVTRLSR